jgi:hypothetical protein
MKRMSDAARSGALAVINELQSYVEVLAAEQRLDIL